MTTILLKFKLRHNKASFSRIAKSFYANYIAFAAGKLSINGIKIQFPTNKSASSISPLSLTTDQFHFNSTSKGLEIFETGAPAYDMWNNFPHRGWLPMHRGPRIFTGMAYLPDKPILRARKINAKGNPEWTIPERKALRPAEILANLAINSALGGGSVSRT